MDDSMIERVARGIDAVPPRQYFWRRAMDKSCYEVLLDTDPDGGIGDDTFKVVFTSPSRDDANAETERLQSLVRARAAIEAMREPNPEMLEAAAPWPTHWERGTSKAEEAAYLADQLTARDRWRDMIDVALAPGMTQ